MTSGSTTIGLGDFGRASSYFTDTAPGGQERLAVAVLQSGLRQEQRHRQWDWFHRIGMSGPVRIRIYSKLMLAGMVGRLLVGVVGRRVFRRRRGVFDTMPPGFNSGSNVGRADETLYSRSRKQVRVAGKDIAIPDDRRTFVVMVRHDRAGGEAEIATHFVDVTSVPPRQIDRTLDKSSLSKAMGDYMRMRHATWNGALHADPVVRAFMEQP